MAEKKKPAATAETSLALNWSKNLRQELLERAIAALSPMDPENISLERSGQIAPAEHEFYVNCAEGLIRCHQWILSAEKKYADHQEA